MSVSTNKPNPWFPWWAKLLVGIGILALIVLVPVFVLSRAATARWERYANDLREGGVPLTYEEIEALRTPIPDGQNGALVIERLAERLSKVNAERYVFVLGSANKGGDFFTGIARHRIEPSREFLDQHRDLLDELSVLRDMPHGRCELAYEKNPLATLLPTLSPLRTAAKLHLVSSMLMLVDGDLEGAAANAHIQAHLGATLNEFPTVIGRLVQIASDALLVRAVENVLRVGQVGEPVLLRLDEDIKTRLTGGTMRWAFLGERAFFVGLCESLASGDVSLADLMNGTGDGGITWLPEMLIRKNQMRGAEILTWLVDAADDPKAMMQAGQRIDATVPTEPMTHVLVRMLLPSLSRSVVLHLRITAQLECTRVALAAERFRLKTGRLPTSIAELVPDYLDGVPDDPFSDGPLLLRETEDGIVVYSVNEDGEDDGGIVARQEDGPPYLDMGFRLHRPDRRGLLLLDDPPPEDD